MVTMKNIEEVENVLTTDELLCICIYLVSHTECIENLIKTNQENYYTDE